MNFVSITFLCFLAITVMIYYRIKGEYRYLCLLAASLFFYISADAKMVLVLFAAIGLTYVGGYVISKKEKFFWLFFVLNISILLFYKYIDFAIDNLNIMRVYLGIPRWQKWDLVPPIGLSFYIFSSTTYLGDVRKKRIQPEKNILKYAAFVSFFPTILCGPIQKARNLLPQLSQEVSLSYDNIVKGVNLIVWGYFEKLVASNSLAIIVDKIFGNIAAYGGAYYIVAAVSYSLQIYSDFASYSDIARGTAKLFGINVGKNFDNPYLATSISEFWKRWHMSLNSWFVEYVYIPLGGNRKGRARQYLNIMIVFLTSGLWHGASWHYILWGGVNGIYQILGMFTENYREKMAKKIGIERKSFSITILRRAVVFGLVTVTWVLFRIQSISEACYVIKNMILFYPITLFNSDLLLVGGSAQKTLKIMMWTILFLIIQYFRKDEHKCYKVFMEQPKIIQYMLTAIGVYLVFFAWAAGTTVINTQFIYGQF